MIEEVLLEPAAFLEDLLPSQAVICRGEAASGDRGDDVHLLEEVALLTPDGHGRPPELFQHPVSQGCRAGPAARERHHHEQVIPVGARVEELVAVALREIESIELGRLGEGRAAGNRERDKDDGEKGYRSPRHDLIWKAIIWGWPDSVLLTVTTCSSGV